MSLKSTSGRNEKAGSTSGRLENYRRALVIALLGSASLTTHAQSDVSNILHQALAAQGGEATLRAIKRIEWDLVGYRNEIEESERPEGPYVTEFDSITEIHEFERGQFRSVTEATVHPIFKFSRGLVSTGDVAMRLLNGKQVVGSQEQILVAHERLCLSPERLLLTALDASDAHLEADVVLQSVPQKVVAFTLDGAPVRVFLNVYTHLPTAVDYSGPAARTGFWIYLGDVTSRTWYSFWWLAKGGIHLPMQWNIDSNGLPDQFLVVQRLQMNPELMRDDFVIPESIQNQFKTVSTPVSPETMALGNLQDPAIEIAPDVILIPGAWNTTIIRQDDGIVILEAPISSGYSAKVVEEANRRYPGQPIKAVITTSDSWPHLSGIREYVAAGIPIYALDLNQAILERVVRSPHTTKPDKLQRNPRDPIFHLVRGKTIIPSAVNPLEIYPIRGETTERQLLVYFPKQHFLYGSDAFQRNPDGTYNLPQTISELMDSVAREHLDVNRYFMMHMTLSSWADLQKVLDATRVQDSPSGVL